MLVALYYVRHPAPKLAARQTRTEAFTDAINFETHTLGQHPGKAPFFVNKSYQICNLVCFCATTYKLQFIVLLNKPSIEKSTSMTKGSQSFKGGTVL